jgi:HAD superfamily hydrolase (TIGR01549 family)
MTKHIADTIRVVLFDHDDTLVGTIGTKWAEHKFIAQKYYNKTLTDSEIKQHWGKPLAEMVCLLYETDNAQEALDYNVLHHTQFEKELFSATIPVLEHLKERGMQLGIITATSRFSFEHDLDVHKIPRELLSYTQAADDTDFHKPDPRVFDPAKVWLDTQNIRPEEVLYIGDGLHDMKAAISAGFNFLGVQTGLVGADEFNAAGSSSVQGVEALF